MHKCKNLFLRIDGLVIFTATQDHAFRKMIRDVSFALFEKEGRTAYISVMSGALESIQIWFKTNKVAHKYLSATDGKHFPHSEC